MNMIQPVLIPANGALDISVSVNPETGVLLLFWGTALVEQVDPKKDEMGLKLLLGRLYNLQVPSTELVKAFGFARTTIERWGQALKSGDPEELRRALAGQGGVRKVNGPIERYVRYRFSCLKDEVRDYRQRIGEEVKEIFEISLSGERLRQIFYPQLGSDDVEVEFAEEAAASLPACVQPTRAAAVVSLEEEAPQMVRANPEQPKPEEESAAIGANSCASSHPLGLHFDATSNNSIAGSQMGQNAEEPNEGFFCHHAGLALLLPYIHLFLDGWKESPEAAMIRQQCAQILSGSVNHEQGKFQESHSLSLILGVVLKDIAVQRYKCDELATPSVIFSLHQSNILLSRSRNQRHFYFDPHTEEYTGLLKLLKAWCGASHSVRKGLHMDFVHTLEGAPCFVRHFDNYYDARERLLYCREAFRKCLGSPDEPITWYFDRGFHGKDFFERFLSTGDHIVTWEKDYDGKGWQDDQPQTTFTRSRSRNNSRDLIDSHFSYQESPWSKDLRFRRLIVRATNAKRTIELAIICSSPKELVSAVDAIWRMFNRWLQENDFGYLIRHFGINELTSRVYLSYDKIFTELEDREVESRAHKEAAKEKAAVSAALGRVLVKNSRSGTNAASLAKLKEQKVKLLQQKDDLIEALAHAAADPEAVAQNWLDTLSKQVRSIVVRTAANDKKTDKAEKKTKSIARARELTAQLDAVEKKLAAIPKKESRLEACIEEGYVRLDTARKELCDIIRIACRNIFYLGLEPFAKAYDNRRDDHERYRALTRAPGIITQNGTQLDIALMVNMDMQPAFRTIVEKYLASYSIELNKHLNAAGRYSRVTISLRDPATPIRSPK